MEAADRDEGKQHDSDAAAFPLVAARFWPQAAAAAADGDAGPVLVSEEPVSRPRPAGARAPPRPLGLSLSIPCGALARADEGSELQARVRAAAQQRVRGAGRPQGRPPCAACARCALR
jgi:hypothetical protein